MMKSLDPQDSREEDFENWLMDYFWKVYRFHYAYYEPFQGPKLIEIKEQFLRIKNVELFICYLFMDKNNAERPKYSVEINEDLLILNLSTLNSGHSLDEAVSFVSYFQGIGGNIKVGVNKFIVEKLPFVYQFIKKFIPDEKIVILDPKNDYFFKRIYLHRNTHYNYVLNWKEISYVEHDRNLEFFPATAPGLTFADTPALVQNISRATADENKDRFERSDVVMLCKTTDEPLAATPARAMYLSPENRDLLSAHGIKVVSPSQFKSLDEYMTVLQGCRTFVTSYGAAACTNRFFVRPDTSVLVLANKHYDSEYAAPSSPPFRHLRQTHLFPVAKQTFVLDHSNAFERADIDNLLQMVLT